MSITSFQNAQQMEAAGYTVLTISLAREDAPAPLTRKERRAQKRRARASTDGAGQ